MSRHFAVNDLPLVVGVGASAGGLEAFQELLEAIGDAKGIAIVFVQHLDSSSTALLSEILRKTTSMEVVELDSPEKLRAGKVYVCPPQRLLEIKRGVARVVENNGEARARHVIDHFFHSLAGDQSERAVGVILSGAGSDGTLGLKAISDAGGLSFAQEPMSAKFDSMPRSASTTGVADHVLTPAEIANELLLYSAHLSDLGLANTLVALQDTIVRAIPAISQTLKKVTSHNFEHYKNSTLSRRIQRRMQVLKLAAVDDYISYLERHEEEARALFRELLIGVTAFFRDPEVFDSLAASILPNLFEGRSHNDTVRIWVAGCASGAEAYTLAMLCREVMERVKSPGELTGETSVASVGLPEVQIFATDIDERSLQIARDGIYPIGIEDHVSPSRLNRFFTKRGKRYQVAREIRDMVLFSAHNLISDPPFSRIDLISCRNLLIYLGSHLQKKLIPLFHHSLRPSGYLLLGPSENITSHTELFRTVDARCRISQRKGADTETENPISHRQGKLNYPALNEPPVNASIDLTEIRQRIVLEEFAPKACVIDELGQILNAAPNMQKYLSLGEGNFKNNIIKMAASGLRIGLRAAIAEAKKSKRKVQHDHLSIRIADQIQRVMLTVQPLARSLEEECLYLVVFHDVGLPVHRLGKASNTSDTGLTELTSDLFSNPFNSNSYDADSIIVQLERELETTRSDLDQSMQDMEAAIEELKSSNEELLSMNEELQSANEELETSKEEMNAASESVARANSDLQNLLRSSQIATVFLDDELMIRSFTPAITEIYDLISTDIGRPLQRFVPLVRNMPPLPDLETLAIERLIEHTIVAESGKSYIRRVLPYQSHTGAFEGIVVTFLDVTQLQESEARFRGTFDNAAVGIAHVGLDGSWLRVNERLCETVKYSREQLLSRTFQDITHPDDIDADIAHMQELLAGNVTHYSMEKRYFQSDGELIWARLTVSLIRDSAGKPVHFISVVEDVTEAKKQALGLADREAYLRRVIDHQLGMVGILQPDGTLVEANATAFKAAGLQREDVIGKKFWDCCWWNYDEAVSTKLQAEFEKALSGEIVRYDAVIWTAGDSRLTIEFMISPVRDAEGRITHLIPSGVDISDRKRAEETTLQREQRLQLALDSGGMGLWEWDVVADCISWSDQMYAMFGYTREELNPTHSGFLNVVHPDDRPILRKLIDSAFARTCQTHEVEFRVIRGTDKSTIWTHCRGTIHRDIEGRPLSIVSVAVDITDQKKWEQELMDREAHLRRVINNQLGLVGVIDRNGILMEVDDRSLEIAQTRRDDVIGKHFADAPWWSYDPAVAQQIRDAMQRAFSGEVVRYDVSLFAHGSDGVMIDFMIVPVFDASGEVEYLIQSGVDIRDRVKIEQEQRSFTRRMEMALRASGMAAWEWTQKRSIWTHELYHLLGRDTNQEASPELFFSLVHPEDRDSLKQSWEKAINGSDAYDSEFRIIRPDGQVRWLKGLGEVVRDKAGKVVRMYGVNWDSTDDHLQSEKLRESERRAHAANASKSEFLANMSHEIRTPMTAILGYAELLTGLVDQEEANQHLQTIRRNGNYLLQIINDILDLSKIEAGKFDIESESFEPYRLIEDVRSIMEVRAIESGLALSVEYDGNLPRVITSDAKRLKQILINLVGNAIKFTPAGRVQIRVHFDTALQNLRLDVTDTGIGIASEQMDLLFQPFSQGDASVSRNFGGTGLGLVISQRLAEMLGGTITAKSIEGEGSTFSVSIAAGRVAASNLVDYASMESGEKVASEVSNSSISLSCHILIVDDRRDIRFLSKRFLTEAGATTEECEDGLIAVEHIAKSLKNDRCPDLILLDMQMPNLDGYETAKRFRSLGYSGPIVALTADAMHGDMSRCLECGCNDYLSKPIEKSLLLKKIADLLA